MAPSSAADAWNIQFFQRATETRGHESVPAQEFLDSLPTSIRARFVATLDAVANAPPPAFSGGGYWQAMHGEMSGLYEIRIRTRNRNHRLICLLDRPGEDLGGPSIVCLDGFTKRLRAAARSQDYRRVRAFRDEFLQSRQILS